MKLVTQLRHMAVLACAALSLAACKNDGQNPVMTDDKAATLSSPGNGAGNSPTGASGGSATSPAPGNGAAVPGTTGAAASGQSGAYGSNAANGATTGTTTSAAPQPATPPSR